MTMQSELGAVALFGAGGAIGHALATELEARDVAYRTVGRNAATLRREFPKSEPVTADFLTGDGTAEAARGIDTIFYIAGAPYTAFQQHPVMVRNALDAARNAGVKRFLLVSPVYSYGLADGRPVAESHAHEPNTKKGRYRLEQEQAVLERNSPEMRTLVLHLPDFYGPNADLGYANTFIREALAGKTASWIGSLDARREFIYVPDAAEPMLRLAARDDAFGRRWNLGGTTLRARDFIDNIFAAAGRPPKYRTVPKVALQAIGLFVPMMREVAEMYYLLDGNVVLDDAALQAELGGFQKTPVDLGLAQTVAWMRSH